MNNSLSIRLVPEACLYTKAEPITDINADIKKLAIEMQECMEQAKGIGLAAPQIGIAKQMFVTHAPGDTPRVMINPKIIKQSERIEIAEEGCLSIPHIFGDVARPHEITVAAFNESGLPFELNATGLLARVILHEYDHLEGILFWDRMERPQRRRLQKLYTKKTSQPTKS